MTGASRKERHITRTHRDPFALGVAQHCVAFGDEMESRRALCGKRDPPGTGQLAAAIRSTLDAQILQHIAERVRQQTVGHDVGRTVNHFRQTIMDHSMRPPQNPRHEDRHHRYGQHGARARIGLGARQSRSAVRLARSHADGMSTLLQGKRVVVVGGTSGMGLGAARAAAMAGAEVIVAGRRATTSRAVEANAIAFRHSLVDVTDESSVRALFDEIGELDHLFVSATPPSGAPGAFLEQDVAGAQEVMNGKFFGSWACARYAAPNMRTGGSITFLTGCVSVRPRRGATIVTATFAALEAFSQALALELGPLRVN